MNLTRIYAIFLRQYYLLRDNPTRIFQIFVWVTLDMILWGFVSKYLSDIVSTGANVVSIFLGAVVLWGFLMRVQQGTMLPLLEDVWSRNFLNIFASPLKVSEYILGLILTSTVTSILALFVIGVLAGVLFGLSLVSLGLLLVPFLLTLFLFGIALGIFAVGVVLRFGPSSEWLVWPIPAVISPFVGIFYPIASLPPWMQLVSRILPPSYVFEGMRSAISDHTFDLTSLLLGIGLSLVYLLLAYAFFRHIYRMVVRNGLLARYSAESVS